MAKATDAETLPAALYHGTSTGYLDQILRDGLHPDSAGCGYLCYTDTLEVAEMHAHSMAEWDEDKLGRTCEAVVISIDASTLDPGGFRLEKKYIEIGPSGGRACNPEMDAHIKSGRSWTWRELLDYSGAVGYAQVVPVTADMVRELARQDEFAP